MSGFEIGERVSFPIAGEVVDAHPDAKAITVALDGGGQRIVDPGKTQVERLAPGIGVDECWRGSGVLWTSYGTEDDGTWLVSALDHLRLDAAVAKYGPFVLVYRDQQDGGESSNG